MKYQPHEDYSDWAERVRIHELKIANEKISRGEDSQKVLEAMATRIVEKLLHPIYKHVEQEFMQQNKSNTDQYHENYLSKIPPRADHVED